MRREKARELELKGSVATGSSKLAGDKGGGRACEGVLTEGKNMCRGEGTLLSQKDVELGVEIGSSRKEESQKAG